MDMVIDRRARAAGGRAHGGGAVGPDGRTDGARAIGGDGERPR